MIQILLVEDDLSLGATLRDRLVKEGYGVELARTKHAALTQARQRNFDLYVFDIGLPDGTGFELAGELPPRPLIFLSAQGDAESRLKGYDLGAEEYIPKPFHLREVLMRIRHVMENHMPQARLEVAGVRVDFEAFTLEKDGVAEAVAVKDLNLLRLLVQSAPRAISRDEALNLLRGEDNFPSNRTVDNSILRLRAVLGDAAGCIESVRGVGYRWNPPKPETK